MAENLPAVNGKLIPFVPCKTEDDKKVINLLKKISRQQELVETCRLALEEAEFDLIDYEYELDRLMANKKHYAGQ